MGYQLDFYSLPWAILEEKCLRTHRRVSMGRTVLGSKEAEEFIASIRESGVLLSSLDHTSSDAAGVLEHFLGEIVFLAFSATGVREQLVDRELFGIAGDILPAWGGLKLEEVGRLLTKYRMPVELTDDQESWLEDMHGALEEAMERETDIITIYG